MSSIKSNFAWNSLYQIVRIIVPLVTVPIVTRALGSEGLGVYSFTYTIALYGTYLILLGLNQYGNRAIAKVRHDHLKLSRVFWSIYFGQLIIGIVVVSIYLLYAIQQTDHIRCCLLIWTLWLIAEIGDISWFFSGLEEFRLISIRNIFVRLFTVLAIAVFVRKQEDLWVYCIIQSLAFILNSAVLWFALRGRVVFYRPSGREIASHIMPSLILFAPVVAISCYTQLNNILLGALSDMSQVAFYDNSNKITVIPLAIIQSLGTVLLPRMSNMLAEEHEESALKYLDNSMWLSLAMAFGLYFGIAGVAHEFVPVFFGEGFEECEKLMPMLALIIVPCAISSVLGNQWLIPNEKDGLYLCTVICGAIANVAGCLVLIPPYGAVGAALSAILAESVVALSQSFILRASIPLMKYALGSLPFFFAGIAEFIVIKAVAFFPLSDFFLLAVEIITGIAVFCIVSFLGLLVSKDDHIWSLGFGKIFRG